MILVIAQLSMLLIGNYLVALPVLSFEEKSVIIARKHESIPVTTSVTALAETTVAELSGEAVKNESWCSIFDNKPGNNEMSAGHIFLASNQLMIASSHQKKSITGKNLTAYKSNYIKYDSSGKSLPDDAEHWSCVNDIRTGLMWEVKSAEGGLRHSKNLYSWYNPVNKSLQGEPDGGRCLGGIDCDTDAYVQAMNTIKYCGFDEWYLPSKDEMQSLIVHNNHNRQKKVTIDIRYFPQTIPSWYWTSSDHEEHDEFAWFILFRNGLALSDLKERAKHIRLVRKTLSSHL